MDTLAPVLWTGQTGEHTVTVSAVLHLGVDKPYVVSYESTEGKSETRHADYGVANRAALKWITHKIRGW